MLALGEGTILVRVARTAIESHLSGKARSSDLTAHPRLMQPQGVFVSLTDSSRAGALRGCVGNPFPDKPLIHQTVQSAIEAATMDPRSGPMTREELSQIIVEVTTLSQLETIQTITRTEIPGKVVIGRHGLVVDGLGFRGLLLPQVALEEKFDSEDFLTYCCMKAGLPPDAWFNPRVRVSRFEGQVFSEQKPGGPIIERQLYKTRAD